MNSAQQVAYILSEMNEKKSSSWNNRQKNGAQVALWHIIDTFLSTLKQKNKGFNYGKTPSVYDEDYENDESRRIFAESVTYGSYDSFETTRNDTKISVSVFDNNYYKIGPFNISFADCVHDKTTRFAGFESANLKVNNVDLDSANWNLCDENGNEISKPTSGTDFYIKVKKNKIGANVSFSVQTKRMTVNATFYTKTSTGGHQLEAIVASAKRDYKTEVETFEIETLGNLRIAKKDADSGNALKGVGFKIKNSSGQYIQALNASKKVQASATGIITNIQFTKNEKKATKFLTDDKGIIELHNIPVDTYTINETSVGEHYAYVLNKNNISWEANGKTSTGQSVKVLIKGQSPTIANSTNTMLQDKYVTIATVKNKKQVGGLRIEKRDERDKNKKLPDVEFVIKSSASNNAYIKVKATGSNVTNDTDGWATRIVGSSTINDTEDIKSNPTLGYTTSISDATVFVTNSDGIIEIQNLISIKEDGTTMIEYTLEEIKNPNYGYLSGNNGEIKYTGKSITPNGTIKLTTSGTVDVIATNPQKYIRLAGFVWEDNAPGKDSKISNKYEDTDYKVEGIQVKLYKNGTFIAETKTDENGEYQFGTENKDHYENTDYVKDGKETGNLRIEDLSQYYVEFEYDGLKYTSVAVNREYSNPEYLNTSKAAEISKDRATVNSDFEIISYNKAHSKSEDTYELEYDTTKENVSTYNYNKYWKYGTNSKGNLQVEKVKNDKNKNYEVLASTRESEESKFDIGAAWMAQFPNTYSDVLKGINLGIKRRTQADLAVSSDLNKVEIKINTASGVYMNTYEYGKRNLDGNENAFGVETKFGQKTGKGDSTRYSDRNLNLYTRRIYESDLVYDNNKKLMQIYVTYRIRVKNQTPFAAGLTSKVNEIANYYDKGYTIKASWIGDNKEDSVVWNSDSNYNPRKKMEEMDKDNYKAGYTNSLKDRKIEGDACIDIYIKFELDNATVGKLLEQQTTLNNVSEITSFSTIDKNGAPYAAIDEDSNPGSAEIKLTGESATTSTDLNGRTYNIENKKLDTTTYEDDTDMAPSLVLGIEKDNPTRGLSGTVFEDKNTIHSDNTTHAGDKRLGNGKLDNGENKIQNVTVELLEYDGNKENNIAIGEDGNEKHATLYQTTIDENKVLSTVEKEATVKTDESGKYEFKGVIPGRYLIRYTYGENKDGEKTYFIDTNGNKIEVNARDYKSTIITSSIIEKALNLNAGDKEKRMGDLNWILNKEKNEYSDAIDDINKRNSNDDLYFGSYLNYGENSMTSDTAFFDVGVEYSEVSEENSERVSTTKYQDEYYLSNGNILVFDEKTNTLKVSPTFYAVNPNQDFGIIERPRQEYVVNKRVSNLKVTLANGQILINGNPYKNNPNSIEELEEPSENPLPYVKAIPGLVTAEIDNEILQAAKLNIEYTISIKNNSELDYDYTKPGGDKYYYFGDASNAEPIKAAIKKVVDYMENGLVYDEEANKENWEIVTPEKLTKYTEDGVDKQLIATGQEINGVKYNVYGGIKQGYTIAITNAFDKGIEVTGIESTKIYGSKVLSTSENGINVLNHTEIIETKGIRPIKDSIPGNYNPELGMNNEINEPDDDWTKLTITPPLGLTDNKTYVILITATALLVLAGGVYIIKKKVI